MDFKLTRRLHIAPPGGLTTEGDVTIWSLRFDESKAMWACQWSMDIVHPNRANVLGEDPMDAVSLCLRFLGTLIRGHENDGWRIHWLVEGDHGGFTEFLAGSDSRTRP